MTCRSATPAAVAPSLPGSTSCVPAGSLAIVGQNGAGKTTLAKLLCRLYDPTGGAILVDGVDLAQLRAHRLAPPCRRGFPGLRSLRTVLARQRRPCPWPATTTFGRRWSTQAPRTWPTWTRPWPRGTATASTCLVVSGSGLRSRGPCAVRRGAGLVLLDEPTAQLDVRGEAEVFDRCCRQPATSPRS